MSYADSNNIQLGVVEFAAYARLLESRGFTAQVDDLIAESTENGWVPNTVFLSGLVNVAAEKHEWQRAEDLWHTLVEKHHVSPNSIAYATLAKAHLLSGRPAQAVVVIEEMMLKGVALVPEAAEKHIQAALVVYHASLCGDDYQRLVNAFRVGKPLMRNNSKQQSATLKTLERCGDRLLRDPKSLRFRDLILTVCAKSSRMSSWKNHRAGSGYIQTGSSSSSDDPYVSSPLE
eukprot:TRINITY_DN55126_c0_g1_i2.p1 TRINITY_DN55126_c0_g1~~TRINITY_DN55126_c0_g1_i2.p1  ORF type:complete len:232 (-),score=22.08 TRINITY_DN55126_c0_g1_i2:463-1158(-)